MRAVSLSSVLIATALGLLSPRLASADDAAKPANTDEAPPAAAPVAPVKPPSVQLIEVWLRSKQALLYDRSHGTYVVVRVGDDVAGLQVASLARGEVVLRARGASHREYVLFPTPLLPTDAQGAAADGDDDEAAPDDAPERPLPPSPLDPYPAGVLDPYGTEGVREVPAPSAVREVPAPSTARAPATPGAPAQPATPGAPASPTTAAAPTATPTPAAPAATTAPATPPATTAPASPATTTAPATPGAPRSPSIPVPPMPTGSSSLFVTSAPPAGARLAPPTPSPSPAPSPSASPAPAPKPTPVLSPTPLPVPSPVPTPSPSTATSLPRRDLDRALSDFDALSRDVDARLAADGATLVRVAPASLLYRVGLREGDRVTAVDGKPLRSLDDAAALYARLSAPSISRFAVDITRGTERITLRVQVTK